MVLHLWQVRTVF